MVSGIKNAEKDEDGEFENMGVVKKYFSRIYTVLKPDIRDRIEELPISENKKNKIRKELAFLSREKQYEYLDEICNESEEIGEEE